MTQVLEGSEWELVLKGLQAKRDEIGQKKTNLQTGMAIVGPKRREELLRQFQALGQEEAACSRLYSKIAAIKDGGGT